MLLRVLKWFGLAKEDEFAQKIDDDRIRDVAVPAHNFFVHRHNHERIAGPVAVVGFQYAIVKRIDSGFGSIRMPFLAL
jgi:hypothetical protein